VTPNQRALRRSEIELVFGKFGFGDFRFASFSTELRRDWLGDSLGYTLNFHTRAFLMYLSRLVLPSISQGNGLVSVLRRLPDSSQNLNASATLNQGRIIEIPPSHG
jgi:hypothetical protein